MIRSQLAIRAEIRDAYAAADVPRLRLIAGNFALILGPTYYLRRRIGTKRWRQIHRLTVVVFVLAVAHSLGSGTDGAGLWMRTMVIGSAVLVAGLVAVRYGRLAPERPKAAAPAPGRPTAAKA